MNLLNENHSINNALLNWEFEKAIELKKLEVKNDISYAPQYCKYLADIGKIDLLLSFIEKLKNDNMGACLLYSDESFKVCRNLLYSDEKIIKEYFSKNSFFSRVYFLSKNLHLGELRTLLLSQEWNINVNASISAENNMILNFALDKLLSNFMVDVTLLIKFIDHIFAAKNINDIRKKSIIYSIVNYCALHSGVANEFFRLKKQYYNHLQKTMSIIHSFSRENGAKLLMVKLYQQLQKYNDLSLDRESISPRVAICISGMSRADISGLKSIFEHLVQPLNADVFMHTWDIQQEWIGGARANDRFWFRTFNVDESKMPKTLLNLNYLKENFPAISESLLTASYSELNENIIKSEFEIVSLSVENQDDFLRKYEIGDSYKSRDTLNQIKMFYGMSKAFSLLKEHERDNNIKYDYVIKLRPDLIIKKGLEMSDLFALNASDFAVPTGFYGIQDMVFYAPRDIYCQIVNIFDYMLESKKLSPLKDFPKYDAHALFFGWLLHKDIRPVLCNIKYNIEEGIRNLRIPNLAFALEKDINVLTKFKYPEESKWLESLLKNKAK
ncbi:hypothetical protein F543_19550 [Bibersteinia trehalosi USDA-ARS-USMARC-189]|uniref:Uncharacterized protein n=1 Tax=Bibersteinia trehalosi USDA-ARS-USMARC-189 TaxID=1263831 RepID=A0ABN4C0M8_BIBTR|nr:hypothetical protein [Bibersteinia trehalosi]AHG84816.1 hypothetical protein F543_19550 [Bibersteinia trehalosi USDA-ARS-USMARC-189]